MTESNATPETQTSEQPSLFAPLRLEVRTVDGMTDVLVGGRAMSTFRHDDGASRNLAVALRAPCQGSLHRAWQTPTESLASAGAPRGLEREH